MKKVPKVDERHIPHVRNDVEEVTSLGVSRAKDDLPVFYLEAGVFWRGKVDGRTILLALSPPAAKHLASLLNQAIDDYLCLDSSQET